MHKHDRLGGLGACSPMEFLKLDALGLLLRPFWDRSKAVVATWLMEHCIQFLAVHIYEFAIPADLEFPRQKVIRLTDQQVG